MESKGCPYRMSCNEKRAVRCAGLEDGSSYTLRFDAERSFRYYERHYCSGAHRECPLAGLRAAPAQA